MTSNMSATNGKRMGAPATEPSRTTAIGKARRVALGALAVTIALALACAGALWPESAANAGEAAVVHVSYQWYSSETGMTEDYEAFDVDAEISDGLLTAMVMPEAYDLGDGCSWRVMKNFAGGLPAGETEITDEVSYDEATGELSLPAQRAGEDITAVFCMPWDHASHASHGHFRTTATRANPDGIDNQLKATGIQGLRAAGSAPEVGKMYYLSVESGETGLWSSPIIYGADSDNAGAGAVFGYPEFEGRYKFYVAFERGNCELFELADAIPGRQGAGGTIYGSTGTPYNTDWAANYQWCSADCVEAVYNTGGDPVPLAGDGSWVRVDSMSDNTLDCTFRIECDNPDGSNAQDIMGTFELPYNPNGAIALRKDSADPALTEQIGCYSLEGSVFGVFETEEDAQAQDASRAVGTFSTDKGGTWESDNEFSAGTVFYVAELEAPEGYALSDAVLAAAVEADETTWVSIEDEPLVCPADFAVQKPDSVTGYPEGQGDGSLEGAEITFGYYDGYYTASNLPDTPMRTWVMKTNEDGAASPLFGESMKVDGDALFQDDEGGIVIPLGTITVTETAPPTGYRLKEPKTYVAHVKPDPASGGTVVMPVNYDADEASDANEPIIREEVMRGNIALSKADADTGKRESQGDASLAGATYEVINRSARAIMSPQSGDVVEPGGVVCTITTDETGAASTANAEANGWTMPIDFGGEALAYGTYEVREQSAAEGYLVNVEFSETVTLRADGQLAEISTDDAVQRGRLVVGKVSRENTAHIEQGAATLEGWSFEIVNESAHAVVVDGALHAPGDVVKAITTKNVDGMFVADTGENALPYGTYEVHEVPSTRPEECGYLFDGESEAWSKTFSIQADGQVVDYSGFPDACANQVVRGDLSLIKAKSPSMKRLFGIPFKITSKTTGEWHVIVTDANGIASTESAYHGDGGKTNANDAAIADGNPIEESKLDPEAGIWFDGHANAPTSPHDDKGALPFDTYLVEELPVKSNEGLGLISLDVTVTHDGRVIELGTIDNAETIDPQISTSLQDAEGNKLVAASDNATLVDTVTYNNLDITASYRLRGTLVIVENGVAAGEIAATELEFSPDTTHGTVQLTFAGIDTSALEGRMLVCFERLYDASGNQIAEHADPADEGQTVSIPTIATTLIDTASGDHVATRADEAFELTDTVSYKGLVPFRIYTVSGQLRDKSTGDAVIGSSGSPVTASTSFIPESPDGTIGLTFAFNATDLEGKHIVAFESLLQQGVEYAVHADIEDQAQTVVIPSIGTTLTDASTGRHAVGREGSVQLVDKISYENLIPERTYTATATLYDRKTGTPVMNGAQPLQATTNFAPESPSGEALVGFDVDAAVLPETTVCFERVTDSAGRTVAVHQDLDDAGQTVFASTVEQPDAPIEQPTSDAPDIPTADYGDSSRTSGHSSAVKGAFDKTGYWLLQHWPALALIAVVATIGGVIISGKGAEAWRQRGKTRESRSARR